MRFFLRVFDINSSRRWISILGALPAISALSLAAGAQETPIDLAEGQARRPKVVEAQVQGYRPYPFLAEWAEGRNSPDVHLSPLSSIEIHLAGLVYPAEYSIQLKYWDQESVFHELEPTLRTPKSISVPLNPLGKVNFHQVWPHQPLDLRLKGPEDRTLPLGTGIVLQPGMTFNAQFSIVRDFQLQVFGPNGSPVGDGTSVYFSLSKYLHDDELKSIGIGSQAFEFRRVGYAGKVRGGLLTIPLIVQGQWSALVSPAQGEVADLSGAGLSQFIASGTGSAVVHLPKWLAPEKADSWTVSDKFGNPISGAIALARSPGCSWPVTVRTDQNGRFSLPGAKQGWLLSLTPPLRRGDLGVFDVDTRSDPDRLLTMPSGRPLSIKSSNSSSDPIHPLAVFTINGNIRTANVSESEQGTYLKVDWAPPGHYVFLGIDSDSKMHFVVFEHYPELNRAPSEVLRKKANTGELRIQLPGAREVYEINCFSNGLPFWKSHGLGGQEIQIIAPLGEVEIAISSFAEPERRTAVFLSRRLGTRVFL
ncbi:MAG: carboxypeptidase regulatory-like domain-containing protein [Planctomycetota bacterium]|nr:MAG: carboxypeptidase regulatory-like domain-containing protein [Planctomycetota bacterium]